MLTFRVHHAICVCLCIKYYTVEYHCVIIMQLYFWYILYMFSSETRSGDCTNNLACFLKSFRSLCSLCDPQLMIIFLYYYFISTQQLFRHRRLKPHCQLLAIYSLFPKLIQNAGLCNNTICII